jgi:hypothetical protein
LPDGLQPNRAPLRQGHAWMELIMIPEWLTERCPSLDPYELRFQEMASIDLSEENKRKLLSRSEQFERWIKTKWKPFVADMLTGDELWRFRSPSTTWANMGGRAGYAIVRDGRIIRWLVTLMS